MTLKAEALRKDGENDQVDKGMQSMSRLTDRAN